MIPFNNPQQLLLDTSLVDRFLEYVKIETTSDPRNPDCPSSQGQWTLARRLVQQLREMGIEDAAVDDNCYVTATINGEGSETVGLLAHLDTSNGASGTNVQPIIHKNYDGHPIHLKNEVVLDPAGDIHLAGSVGDTIITSDGTTLLGADDKAGIAVIMAAVEYISQNPDFPHPTVRIGFTPDEEIGRGHEKFPLDTFGATVAFTVDGSVPGEMNIETFEAASAHVEFTGVSIHPGQGKNRLVNALRHMSTFLDNLPLEFSPERTDNREPFIHPIEVQGDASYCSCHLLLRAFEEKELQKLEKIVRKQLLERQQAEPKLIVKTTVDFSYPNMYKYLRNKPEVAARLKKSIEQAGLTPQIIAIRGGTDGANLSRKGLPTPNIFAGGINFHGPTEWISTKNMGYSLCTILNLLSLYAANRKK